MAYMSQQRKKELAPQIKAICKKYGIRASLAVLHNSTLELNISQGKIDFIGEYLEWLKTQHPGRLEHNGIDSLSFSYAFQVRKVYKGQALEFLEAVLKAMHKGNHDRSDSMTDYFDVGWYVSVNIGRWNKPYKLIKG